MKRTISMVLCALALASCGKQVTTTPERPAPILTIATELGQVEINQMTVTGGQLVMNIVNDGKNYTVASASSAIEGTSTCTRTLTSNGQMLARVTERTIPSTGDYLDKTFETGDHWVRTELLPAERLARYTRDNVQPLIVDNFVWSQADEYQLKRAVYAIKAWLPSTDPMFNNHDLVLMESIVGNEQVQATALSLTPASGISPQGGCSGKLMLVAGIAAKYGCRFWAVPNPVIAGIAATACVAGNGIFWGCVVAAVITS